MNCLAWAQAHSAGGAGCAQVGKGWAGPRTSQVPWQANRAEGRPGFTHCGARWGRVDATRAEVALDVANVLVVGLGARQVNGARALVPGQPFRALREMRAGLVNVEAEDRDPRPRVEAKAGGRIGRGVGSVQGVQIIAERDQRRRVRPVQKGEELGVPARVMNGAPSKQDEGCIQGWAANRDKDAP